MNPELHWVLFEDEPELKRRVWLGFDKNGVPRGAHTEQHVDQILENNAEAEKATQGVRFGDYNRVASVPVTFFEQKGLGEAVDGGDRKYLQKILNDPDNAKFRTSRGRI